MPDARISAELDRIEQELPDALSLVLNPAPADPVTGRRRIDDWRLTELSMRADALVRQAGLDPEKVSVSKAKRAKDEEGLSEAHLSIHRKIKALHGAAKKQVDG
jgi:hypothetical protein